MDEDGYLFIVDRTKDMLLCGGFNVYPRNIEEAIYSTRQSRRSSVIGVPRRISRRDPQSLHQAEGRRARRSRSTN